MDWGGGRCIEDRCKLFHGEKGILLDIPSLPGSYGIGELGPHALKWIRFLSETGQRLWHILSLRETVDFERFFANTSYGWNTDLISFVWLRDEGLVAPERLEEFKQQIEKKSRAEILQCRRVLLSEVANTFEARASAELLAAFMRFKKFNQRWLGRFALFRTLKDELQTPWYAWPEALRQGDPVSLEKTQKQLREPVLRHEILQFLLARHWERVRSAANYAGIRMILSVPVSVAHDSYEVWSNPDLFFVDHEGAIQAAPGLLPSKLLPEGKIFQAPQYRWSRTKADRYRFWINRFRRELQNIDLVNLEHFHMFFECDEFGVNDSGHRRVPTSDQELFLSVREALQTNNFIASDFFEQKLIEDRAIRQLELGSAVLSLNDQKSHYSPRNIVYTSHYVTPSGSIPKSSEEFLRKTHAGALMTTLPDLLGLKLSPGELFSWRFEWLQITKEVQERLLARG